MPRVKKTVVKKVARKRAPKKGGSILSQAVSVALQDDDTININLYGRSGTGKTTLACTFPKPLLILSFEVGKSGGTKSVHNVKGVEYLAIKTSEELSAVTEELADSEYNTVVVDTAGGLQDMVLREILELDQLPAQRSWGMAKQQEWGQCALQTKERLRALLDLPIHTVIVAQEREFSSDTESDLVMPYIASALTPSVTGWLNPACDYIGQTYLRPKTKTKKVTVGKKTITKSVRSGGMEYCLRTAPDEIYTTKFRLPKGSTLPPCIVDPDFDKIYKLISQGG